MLEGVVPFPPEFAKRYRDKGYWIDKTLAQEYRIAFDKYENRVALLDRDRSITYGELDRMSDNLALNLLEIGFQPLDRVVVQLPNVAEFVVLYLALQKIGCIPIAALMPHRFAEISQFVELSGAVACVVPDQQGDFDYCAMVERIRQKVPKLRHGIVLGPARPGFSIASRYDREAGESACVGTCRDPHRSRRPGHLSTFRWDDRHSEADSANA